MSTSTHPYDHVSHGLSRRAFLKRLSVAGLAMSVASSAALSDPAEASAAVMPAYRIDYSAAVLVSVGAGSTYDVIASDLDGNVLEIHRNMNSRKLQRVESPYFTVTGIIPPS